MRIVVAVLFIAFVVLVLFPIARMGWQFMHGDIEAESGGSFGKQLFGRKDDDTL